MKIRFWLTFVTAAVFFCGQGFSATMAGVGVREAASFGEIEKCSVGLGAEWINRDIDINHVGDMKKLEAQTLDLFVGYDAKDWLTVFATFGFVQVKPYETAGYGDRRAKGSIGLQGNLWQTEIVDPDFMTGKLTLKTLLEFSRYQVDEEKADIKGHWNEYSFALPFCYEIFTNNEGDLSQGPYSLAILLGPAVSIINGNVEDSFGEEAQIREKKTWGILGGVDIYISHNFSVGCQVEYFDRASVGGNIIYHF
ncbi:MAG: hypothetical protein PHR77_02280 [Kiritimatiellae bacterium]|nr:hypothetical protein [Kiritimatiellia bacterium]MDD5521797.1 hypothetical protein [Kiritimatiellia bacterium]